MGNNSKLWEWVVQLLYTALLLIEIYLPVKFQVDTSYSFCVMLWTEYLKILWNHWANWSKILCGTNMG